MTPRVGYTADHRRSEDLNSYIPVYVSFMYNRPQFTFFVL